jgi:hypothetical protein
MHNLSKFGLNNTVNQNKNYLQKNNNNKNTNHNLLDLLNYTHYENKKIGRTKKEKKSALNVIRECVGGGRRGNLKERSQPEITIESIPLIIFFFFLILLTHTRVRAHSRTYVRSQIKFGLIKTKTQSER